MPDVAAPKRNYLSGSYEIAVECNGTCSLQFAELLCTPVNDPKKMVHHRFRMKEAGASLMVNTRQIVQSRNGIERSICLPLLTHAIRRGHRELSSGQGVPTTSGELALVNSGQPSFSGCACGGVNRACHSLGRRRNRNPISALQRALSSRPPCTGGWIRSRGPRSTVHHAAAVRTGLSQGVPKRRTSMRPGAQLHHRGVKRTCTRTCARPPART